MKKVVVLLAIVSLLAAPAFAGIRNSKHDLSSSSNSANTVKSDNTQELCVFCHTPHGGETGGFAPLWNRSLGALTLSANDLYNSVTLNAASKPSAVEAEVIASDAKLCLSCHNGDSLATGLINPPITGTPTFTGYSNAVTGFADLTDGGNSLTNDHPIGMAYATVAAEIGGEIIAPVGTGQNFVDAADRLPLYGPNKVMWCSSCHDVHNSNKGTPFLNMTNVGSAMCLACHDK